MQARAETQKEQADYNDRLLHKTDADTSYLIHANWLDRIAHVPFHFVGKNIFVGFGIILAIIISLVTTIPFYMLGIVFVALGIGFGKFLNFKSLYPPFFYSYRHAESYNKGEWWDKTEQSLLDAQEDFNNQYHQYKEKNPESARRYEESMGYHDTSEEQQSSNFVGKVGQVNDFVETTTSLVEDPLGTLFDRGIDGLIGGESKERQSSQSQQSYEQNEERPSRPAPLSKEQRQELFNQSMKELHSMIGLEEVKGEVKNIILEIKANKKLEKQGITPEKNTMHMIFNGPPGTGKTEVSRLLSKILQATGYLENGHLVEAQRGDLVAEYQGQTAKKVMDMFEQAKGGVLFIDEAYSLKNGDNDMFGQEAIDTIIKCMEDYRKEMVVILAGYDAEMNKLMKANPGFASRIAYKFRFTDYTPDQLTQLAMLYVKKRGYEATSLQPIIRKAIKSKEVNGAVDGNGRWVRNFIDKVEKHHKIMIANNEISDVRQIQETVITKAIKEMK